MTTGSRGNRSDMVGAMGYSSRESDVRVDRFKPSGKWYDTFALDMSGDVYDVPFIHDAVARALARMQEQSGNGYPSANEGWFVVVLDPYHPHAHPIVLWGRGDGTWGTGKP